MTRRTRFTVFEEADGWHYSDKALDHLDARGKAYPTKAAAKAAAEQRKAELAYNERKTNK